MALSEAYNVSGKLWIGPDSAKSNVDANSGRVYMASDTQVEYYGDNGSWQKMGVGSSSEPVPSVTTEDVDIGNTDLVSTGEFVPRLTLGGESASQSTTSSSYSFAFLNQVDAKMDESLLPGGNVAYALRADFNPSTDQIDIQLWNSEDGEAVIEKTGITTASIQTLGPVTYTAPNGTANLTIKIRNGDGTTSVEVVDPHVFVGVKL